MSQSFEEEMKRVKKILMHFGCVHRAGPEFGPIDPLNGQAWGQIVARALDELTSEPGTTSRELHLAGNLLWYALVAHTAALDSARTEALKTSPESDQEPQNRPKPPARTKARLGRETTPRGRKGGTR